MLNIWGNGYYMVTDKMIARYIIVSFCIDSQLKYAKIYGRNLGHDIYGVK